MLISTYTKFLGTQLVWATLFMITMWVIELIYITFDLESMLKVLVGSLREDLGENPWSWARIIATLSRHIVWPTIIISPLVVCPL